MNPNSPKINKFKNQEIFDFGHCGGIRVQRVDVSSMKKIVFSVKNSNYCLFSNTMISLMSKFKQTYFFVHFWREKLVFWAIISESQRSWQRTIATIFTPTYKSGVKPGNVPMLSKIQWEETISFQKVSWVVWPNPTDHIFLARETVELLFSLL